MIMVEEKAWNKVDVLIVGAGPAGLACALVLKKKRPELDVCVIDKASDLGNHNLSGAVLEPTPLHILLDLVKPDWRESDFSKEVLGRKVEQDDVYFLPSATLALKVSPLLRLSKVMHLAFGEMLHFGDYIVSVSKLTRWLGKFAREIGVEVLCGFSASELIWDVDKNKASGVRLVDQGLDKEGRKQPNYLEGEFIQAEAIVLAEGCDGLLTEQFIDTAGLKRQANQLYSIGVKELVKVTPEQFERYGGNRVVHALGYPIWAPFFGPGMFGGGMIYPFDDNILALGMIVGLDWKERDFNPQDALSHFKNHSLVKPYIEGGQVVEAGAKMIPEGGYYALPRDPKTGAIGKNNVLIIGDSAGFVNMLKIKGLHNAIDSGMTAAAALGESLPNKTLEAKRYTEALEKSCLMREMKQARKFRQAVAKLGNLIGMPFSALGEWVPRFEVEPDYKAMTTAHYRHKGNREFDKDTFTAMALTEHREEQPSHLKIVDPKVCAEQCAGKFASPCITFCPAGVYEEIQGELKPANASNCLHCKTCQRKCPYFNIRWTVPEGGGGPRYKRM